MILRDRKLITEIERKLSRILFDESRHPNKYEQHISSIYSFLSLSRNIKPLSVEHLPKFAEVIRKSFSTVAMEYGLTIENFPNHWSFASDERLSEKLKDGCYPFGYFSDGELVGFVSLTDIGEGIFELGTLSVLPEYRHLGYGKALIDFCKEKIRNFGGRKIIISLVDTHVILKEWYVKNGFIHVETKIYEHMPLPVGYMEWYSDCVD